MDKQDFVIEVASCAARCFEKAGLHISFEVFPTDLAAAAQSPKAGLLAAGLELRDLLAHSAQGRKALQGIGWSVSADSLARLCSPWCVERAGSETQPGPSMQPLAQVVLTLLPQGRVRISSERLGAFDSIYPPMEDGKAAEEVNILLAELRRALAGVTES